MTRFPVRQRLKVLHSTRVLSFVKRRATYYHFRGKFQKNLLNTLSRNWNAWLIFSQKKKTIQPEFKNWSIHTKPH